MTNKEMKGRTQERQKAKESKRGHIDLESQRKRRQDKRKNNKELHKRERKGRRKVKRTDTRKNNERR
ncbi:hypothetical protein ILYODFUR_034615 [Ilyodon furcidens]|uniref:Uncharacterized protein n=1 Tax=Ilyodon furcidens TaxID=33524 RepID=A0ABV0V961_9TELE